MKAYIMIGIPGSGKTTYIKENLPDVTVCSADHFFEDSLGNYNFNAKHLQAAHAQCLRKYTRHMLFAHSDVAVDNTNTSVATVAPYIALAKAFNYEVECIAFTATHMDDCLKRCVHNVPRAAFENMTRKVGKLLFHWPSFWPKVTYV